ncbi:Serine/threonine-protein kinase fray2 [Heracleum sosnowskyi]|uniref:Serine/threonine-protein kinase fray2 n=1 Tax=Heracleum sosnowskyi TaxID=360622 RepID=A0AAD8M1L8_9APIA|nr:Serine/threonine-protein kinase fray2 [Heracleum sosnowskyi]
MADRNLAVVKPIWLKQAEEAKLKSEAEKTAAAKAAFDATFKNVEKSSEAPGDLSDSDTEEAEDLANKPIGPVDPAKCTAAGTGIAGGTACAPSSFVIVTKDTDGRKVPTGGAQITVKVKPGQGVGATEQEGIVKDAGDGTYTITYVVPKRGNYMVEVECNGKSIMGSPFPVFFSAGSTTGGLLGLAPQSNFPNLVNQTMPNMPNYSGGAVLPGLGATLGEVCREYLNGRCVKSDCRLNHPPHSLLMTALAATTSMGTLSQVPMAPSAAAMAAAQAIVAAQALQAHAAQAQAQSNHRKDSSESVDKDGRADSLKKTVQVSNLSPLITVDQLKQLFAFCGTVVECSITESKHFAYIEYLKPDEASAALSLNNLDVGGRPLNVEMAKSLPAKPAVLNPPLGSSSLPMVMQQAVAMQQMQFQQSLLMQQSMAAQQAANRAATMKSATDLAAARAAEISRSLKIDGSGVEDKETQRKSRSPSAARARSRSKSKSPVIKRRRSRSYSPLSRRARNHRSRSPFRSRHYSSYDYDRRSYRDSRDDSARSRRRDFVRLHDRHSPRTSRRNRSRSASPRTRKTVRDDSYSPKRRRESPAHKGRKASHASSRSPGHYKGSKSSPSDDENKFRSRRRSRSKSVEVKHRSSDKLDENREGKLNRRDRRRSRSASLEGKHQKKNKIDDAKSKHRRRSRSKSPEDKHHSSDKYGKSREERSKHRSRRRSRSTSVEDDCRRSSRASPKRSNEQKSSRRRRSRSKSVDYKHRENKDVKEKGKEEKGNHKDKGLVESDELSGEADHNLMKSTGLKDDRASGFLAKTNGKITLVMEDDDLGDSDVDRRNSKEDKTNYERHETTRSPGLA